MRQYVEECIQGKAGCRGADFNMRWIASLVAEVHRILIRGGLFMYPRDTKDPVKPGRLRLLYEANPIAMIVEQAGGGASTGRQRILDLEPNDIHQRVPVILGSRHEVERLVRYHEAYDRGDKFAHYRRLECLTDFLLIAQNKMRVERFRRQGEQWVLTEFTKPEDSVCIDSIGCVLSLAEIYDRVEFPGETGATR